MPKGIFASEKWEDFGIGNQLLGDIAPWEVDETEESSEDATRVSAIQDSTSVSRGFVTTPWSALYKLVISTGENSTKTDQPRRPLLVGPHAALRKPAQGPAQLRLSLAQAAS